MRDIIIVCKAVCIFAHYITKIVDSFDMLPGSPTYAALPDYCVYLQRWFNFFRVVDVETRDHHCQHVTHDYVPDIVSATYSPNTLCSQLLLPLEFNIQTL